MLIAITGGTGFVGSRLVTLHLQRGDQVRVLARPASNRTRVPSGVELIEAGISTATPELGRFVANADVLYHCAGEYVDKQRMHATNVVGTRNLAGVASGKVRRWVHVSSVAVYGLGHTGSINEESTLRPDSAYGKTKLEAEEIVRTAADKGAFQATILRPSTIFGHDMPGRLLFKLFALIERGWFFRVGKPGAIMNYEHVNNVAAALMLCATHTGAVSRTYNLSQSISIDEFAAMIVDELNVPQSTLRLPELPLRVIARIGSKIPRMPLTTDRLNALCSRVTYSSNKIEQELAYTPTVPIEAGLRELAKNWQRGRRLGR